MHIHSQSASRGTTFTVSLQKLLLLFLPFSLSGAVTLYARQMHFLTNSQLQIHLLQHDNKESIERSEKKFFKSQLRNVWNLNFIIIIGLP